MNKVVLLRTWTMSTHDTKNVNKKGLRYDAGSWVAEILDDVWASYDVL